MQNLKKVLLGVGMIILFPLTLAWMMGDLAYSEYKERRREN